MRKHRSMFIFLLSMVLGMVLLSGCGTLGAGSASGGDSGDGGDDDGSSEDEGSLDEIDLSMGCPEDPVMFGIYLDFQLNVEEDNGYIHERTDLSVGVPIMIHGAEIEFLQDTTVAIPVTIEGVSGDCTISGNAQISLQGGGSCEHGVATLDIQGSYDFYQRSILCPGQPSVDAVDSLFPGPSITADFNLSNSGDTVENSYQAGGMQFIYAWILKPMNLPYTEMDGE